jgi:hypothetical protein
MMDNPSRHTVFVSLNVITFTKLLNNSAAPFVPGIIDKADDAPVAIPPVEKVETASDA